MYELKVSIHLAVRSLRAVSIASPVPASCRTLSRWDGLINHLWRVSLSFGSDQSWPAVLGKRITLLSYSQTRRTLCGLHFFGDNALEVNCR
jgi:hypothetical protein